MTTMIPYPPQLALKRKLARRGISYRRIAADAGVSWSMVYQVLAGRKRSARVVLFARLLAGEK